jgi:hypothetical protein
MKVLTIHKIQTLFLSLEPNLMIFLKNKLILKSPKKKNLKKNIKISTKLKFKYDNQFYSKIKIISHSIKAKITKIIKLTISKISRIH